MRIIFNLFLLLFALSTSISYAETIKITNGEWPPYLSKNYKHAGVASHIVTEAFKAEGIDVEYGFFPWARSLNQAKDGDPWAASAIWSKNKEREADFLYSDPVFSLKTVFFHKKDITVDWKDLSDLSKYKIGATKSYNYGEEFKVLEDNKTLKVQRVPKDLNNFKKLLAGRIDLFPVEMQVGYELITNELTPAKAAMLTNTVPFHEKLYHLIISKAHPKAEFYLESFNKGLAKLKASGTYQRMLNDDIEGKYKIK